MKIKLIAITTALLSALALSFNSEAQTTNAPKSSIWGSFEPLFTATNWTVSPYMTYASTAPSKFGGGVLCVYNVNNYVGAGAGVDWLGRFNLVSCNATLRFPISFTAFGKPLTATPFAVGGIATPFGGTGVNNGNIATIEGAGASVHGLLPKNIGLGAAYVNWTGAGDYSGRHLEAFVSIPL